MASRRLDRHVLSTGFAEAVYIKLRRQQCGARRFRKRRIGRLEAETGDAGRLQISMATLSQILGTANERKSTPEEILASANRFAVQLQPIDIFAATLPTGRGYKYSFSPSRGPCEPKSIFAPRYLRAVRNSSCALTLPMMIGIRTRLPFGRCTLPRIESFKDPAV